MTVHSPPPDRPETLRSGRYRIESLLGEGSQGETFLATDGTTGQRVAIKRFQVRGAKSWKDVELAEREATVLASLDHPHIPHYRDHFEEAGALYLVTDFIEGENLAAMRKRGARFGEADVERLLRETAGTLEYLHERSPPVIHRDIKPGNVIRKPDGSFVLIDFGSVRDRMKPEGGSTVVGTFGYMAPEQFQGRAMPCSDVYALGATALTLLTGREPEALPHKGLAIDVEAALAGSNVRPALRQALTRMLDPDPDRRPASIGPLLAALSTPPPAAKPSSPPKVEVVTKEPKSTGAPWEEAVERAVSRAERHVSRAVSRAERKAARLADRAERRASRAAAFAAGDARGWTPEKERELERGMENMRREVAKLDGLPRVFAVLGITMGLVAVTIAMRVFVPLLLRVMSLVFGRALREAAANVEKAGEATARSMQRTLDSLNGRTPDEAANTESATHGNEGPGVRVDASADGAGAERETLDPRHEAEVAQRQKRA